MYQCKKIKLADGKEMVPARERILFLKEEKIDYELGTEHGNDADGNVICKATLTVYYAGGAIRHFHGTSAGKKNEQFVYETTETKAIGRACAAFGIGIDDSYASADEMPATPFVPIDADPETVVANDAIAESISRGTKVTEAANKSVRRRNMPKEEPVAEQPPVDPVVEQPEVAEQTFPEVMETQPVDDKPMFHNMVEPRIEPVQEVTTVPEPPTKPKENPVSTESSVIPPKPVIEKPVEAQKQATSEVPKSGNKFDITIAELSDKGARPWKLILNISQDLEKAKISSVQLKEKIVSLYPGYESWEEEDIFGGATASHLNEALNLCVAGK